ncbi:arf-GAP domain and FG repeat-containing protein 2 isoform X2 [Silurus meridionalis]|uniref:arf-GAP domain and FG repeat-containing protein 2 isoform X2 n=1 Tax=Silurus meridionalis TaxID=175797 RepID=UPI001EE9DB0A|nr:arf-GAP domain and FG repeat-containing protein 2 isoform X2 [Silurus meridionalis]
MCVCNQGASMSNRKHRDSQEICTRKVRELAQTGPNKHCFECGQPGVTYTDITVGCFVCTSCSGMLGRNMEDGFSVSMRRGLNPPHRVKSISMTTFSQQEVDFLQNHGNEVGKRMWLCTFDPKTDGCFDTRDSQKFKEFLQEKYERKKWHFSKSKGRRDVEPSWSTGVQAPAQTQPSSGHPLNPAARASRALSQAQLPSWDRVPTVSPADVRTEVFTARPTRSQSFRDHTIKDSLLSGMERQRPGTISPGMGPQSRLPSFPALPRPSASSTFKNSFTLGRTVSSGGGAPFRTVPKSLSLDFGGLGSTPSALSPQGPPFISQDKYAAVSQLDKVFSDPPTTVASTVPSSGPPQYSSLFGNRPSSSSTPASSPGVPEVSSASQTFANFPNPFCSTASSSQPALSPSNPFNSTATGDSSTLVSPSPSAAFPHSASFPAPTSHNAFPHEPADNQETNVTQSNAGFASFPALEPISKVQRPVSVNPFTGTVYPARGTSLNPFI